MEVQISDNWGADEGSFELEKGSFGRLCPEDLLWFAFPGQVGEGGITEVNFGMNKQ